MNVTCYYSFESNLQVGILVWIYLYILTSHLVLGLYLTLILKIFILDGHVDDNFERKICLIARTRTTDLQFSILVS